MENATRVIGQIKRVGSDPSPEQQQLEEERRLLARIKRAIRRKTNGGVSALSVVKEEESLLLRGRCASFYCKQVAQHAALDFLDGEQLINQIEVAPR
jgi:hypothetical protein